MHGWESPLISEDVACHWLLVWSIDNSWHLGDPFRWNEGRKLRTEHSRVTCYWSRVWADGNSGKAWEEVVEVDGLRRAGSPSKDGEIMGTLQRERTEASIQSGHHKQAECQLMAWNSAADDSDVICGKNRQDGDYSLEIVHRSRNGNFETCWPPPQCGWNRNNPAAVMNPCLLLQSK